MAVFCYVWGPRWESNGKGRKREFSLAEESPRKPEGFRERRDGTISDIHSSLILGPNNEGNDFMVIDRLELASSVRLNRLSELVERYNHTYKFRFDKKSKFATLNFTIVRNEQKVLDSVTPEEIEKWKNPKIAQKIKLESL